MSKEKNVEEDRLELVLRLLRQAETLIEQERSERRGEDSTVVVMDPGDERVAQLAHDHLAFIQDHGAMTLRDSLAIRRERYGASVQGTARFFGDHFEDGRSSRILYREGVPSGQRRKDDDPVALTKQGLALAERYRQQVLRSGGAHQEEAIG